MNTAELKLNLIDKLAFVNDENLLNQIHILLKDVEVENHEWNTLSIAKQKGLLDAIDEMNSNEGIEHQNIITKYSKKYA